MWRVRTAEIDFRVDPLNRFKAFMIVVTQSFVGGLDDFFEFVLNSEWCRKMCVLSKTKSIRQL